MQDYLKFYINGEWVDPVTPSTIEIEDPSLEEAFARISLGSKADVDKAVAAAKAAFPAFSAWTVEQRAELLDKIVATYQTRIDDIAGVISREMGAPMWLAKAAQAPAAMAHFAEAARYLREYKFEEVRGNTLIRKEPIGVCGFITPWNWPANQIACKVAPALAAGCTMVLKPSEIAPLDAMIIAEVLDAAGVPKGVFNLVNGDGPSVGAAISGHPDVDMVSFTGSTRAGVLVSEAAAPSVKRVALELGGKSPNIVLPDADMKKAVSSGVMQMMTNSGQSCNAPSRMFVPRAKNDEAKAIAKATAEAVKVQAPATAERGAMGPVSSGVQYNKIQALIEAGMKEGATVVAGGPGRPEGMNKGWYVRPTVFADATNDMTIAREEIFGPVLTMIPYDTVDEAVEMANDTEYGLSSGIITADEECALDMARRLHTGMCHINCSSVNDEPHVPFGGSKASGLGRHGGRWSMDTFTETRWITMDRGGRPYPPVF